jgi:hypothetical protein
VASSGPGVAHRRQVRASGGTSVPLVARRRPALAAASVVGGAKAVGAVALRAAGGGRHDEWQQISNQGTVRRTGRKRGGNKTDDTNFLFHRLSRYVHQLTDEYNHQIYAVYIHQFRYRFLDTQEYKKLEEPNPKMHSHRELNPRP